MAGINATNAFGAAQVTISGVSAVGLADLTFHDDAGTVLTDAQVLQASRVVITLDGGTPAVRYFYHGEAPTANSGHYLAETDRWAEVLGTHNVNRLRLISTNAAGSSATITLEM